MLSIFLALLTLCAFVAALKAALFMFDLTFEKLPMGVCWIVKSAWSVVTFPFLLLLGGVIFLWDGAKREVQRRQAAALVEKYGSADAAVAAAAAEHLKKVESDAARRLVKHLRRGDLTPEQIQRLVDRYHQNQQGQATA